MIPDRLITFLFMDFVSYAGAYFSAVDTFPQYLAVVESRKISFQFLVLQVYMLNE